ncbi:MAG: 50S ribosomal protein L7Ae-like protein [Bacillati bacterium ANGP1]|uniref:50S ribosomal protein L7Ae-like protein n=1 Tax=Candidatus Segetimicrobium genomatis TaxID=2569760 RepID=A0A537JVF4_9BACT|nr:MAG: 50S ribosomal protein L7Ae-like protein [Terrabacteria group bacterium ANGP1]
MDLDRLRGAPQRAIGTNQTSKAIDRGRAQVVFVARDADRRVTEPVVREARARGVEIVEVESMAVLGRTCGIAVGAAVAAILSATDRTPEP